MTMQVIVALLTEQGALTDCLGTNGRWPMSDLKTLAGYRRRVRRSVWGYLPVVITCRVTGAELFRGVA